jgi:3-oxoacyl-[acyl-carrier-protein] synthase-3
MGGLRVLGWGAALPDKTVTNADLEARLDTSDTWIRERTGIRERHIGDSTAELAIEAGERALEHAAIDPSTIELVVLCTSTPDQVMPATAAHVHGALGCGGGAMDLNAACAGYVYGLVTAHGLLAGGLSRVLLIGAETMSRIVDWEDRNTAVLFGDGAGALVLEAGDRGQLLGWDLGTDSNARRLLFTDIGGFIQMDGKELFRRAVRVLVESSERALERAGLTIGDVTLLVPHQANVRIVDAACQRLGFPTDRVANVLATTGNTSAASIPIALADSIEAGQLRSDDVVLFSGFGAGMSWASAVLRWEDPR